jgi:hypothetical protein
MTFKIEFSDQRFRVVAPNGDYEEAVGYCSVSTVEVDGTVYGAYLNGDEPELETVENVEQPIVKAIDISVYDFSNWPALESVDTELEAVVFDEDTAAPTDGPVVDVQPV